MKRKVSKLAKARPAREGRQSVASPLTRVRQSRCAGVLDAGRRGKVSASPPSAALRSRRGKKRPARSPRPGIWARRFASLKRVLDALSPEERVAMGLLP